MADLVFQPDNSELSPYILVSGAQLIPNSDGSFRAPYPAVTGAAGGDGWADANPQAAFLAVKPDGTRRLFVAGAGTRTEIEEGDGTGTWTNRLSSATAGSSSHFCQYESQTLYAHKGLAIQTSTSAGFSAVSNAPKALVIDTLNDALWAWNVNDGTDRPDELFITDQGDITDWTPVTDGSSLAFKTRLTDCPGPGTAMIRYRNFMVIFKRRGMWIGQYTGDDRIYDVSLFSADVGCIGKDACLVAGDILYFVDDQNVYSFDGASIRSLSDPFNTKYILQGSSYDNDFTLENCALHFDDINKILSVYVTQATAGFRSAFYPYSVASGKWGPLCDAYRESGSTFEFAYCPLNAPQKELISFGGLGVTATSNENRINVVGTQLPSWVLRNGHNSSTAGSAVTAHFGSAFQAQTLRRIFVNADSNTGMTVSDQTKRAPRSSATTQGTSSTATVSAEMLADLRCDGNFHKLTFAWNAQTNASPADFRKWQGFEMDLLRSGTR